MSNQNWSDDEDSQSDDINNDFMEQPNRDFPPSDEELEEEDEEYDMDNIIKLTLSKSNTWADMFNKKEPEIKNLKSKSNISANNLANNLANNNIKNLPKYEKRKFNPRLPPPDKYNKYGLSNNYKHYNNDFPILK